jgi:hypothetical protein
VSSTYSTFGVASVSEPSAFQYESNNATPSINDETRTIRNETQSNFDDTHSTVINSRPANELSIPSSISFMDTLYTGPTCLTKSNDYNSNSNSANDYGSNVFTDPGQMFTPYVRLFSDNEEEPKQQQPEEDTYYRRFINV